MFRNEKLVLPSILHFALAATVALCAFVMNLYSPAIGYVLALVTLLMIALQFGCHFALGLPSGIVLTHIFSPCIGA